MPQGSRGKAPTNTKRKPPEEQEPAPDWPALQPLIPTTDLALETLLEDQIILIRNLFTSTLCKKYVSFLSSLPLTTTPAKAKEGEAIRANDRIQFHDPAFAEQLWNSTGISSLVSGSAENVNPHGLTYEGAKKLWGGEICGLNPRIRIYRYGTSLTSRSFPSIIDFGQVRANFLVSTVCIMNILAQTPRIDILHLIFLRRSFLSISQSSRRFAVRGQHSNPRSW